MSCSIKNIINQRFGRLVAVEEAGRDKHRSITWVCKCDCGNEVVEEIQLHCHHMDPAVQNPIFQNDMDSCVALCKNCHGWVHTRYGCRYIDLRCKGGM